MKDFLKSLFHFRYLIEVYIGGLFFFTIFRIILYCSQSGDYPSELVVTSFWMGFRFDTVISGYLLALPALLLIMAGFIPFVQKTIKHLVFWFINLTYLLAFFISAADIPYYHHYGSRLNSAALQWIDSPDIMFGMISQEKTFWPFFILWMLMIGFFMYYHRFVFRKTNFFLGKLCANRKVFIGSLIISIFFLGFIMLAIRGRIEKKSPIRIGTAYFCDNSFLNQMGLNPAFTFIQSLIDDADEKYKPVNLMDDDFAVKECKRMYGVHPDSLLPFSRSFQTRSTEKKYNILIVIMESMAMHKTGLVKGGMALTPFIDRLAVNSMQFTRMYSSGIHTFNGLYATLFGYPAIKRQHPMNPAPILTYHGLPSVLKEKGYSNIYFGTHDDQFDNVGGFFRANGFDRIVSQKDFPAEEVVSALGVPDHVMFRNSFKYLADISAKRNPFMAVYLTASDHIPYTIPNGISFKAKSEGSQNQIVEYADWALRGFMEMAKLQPWYSKTIFVFLADHGTQVSNPFGFSTGFHHIPFLIFSPDSSVFSGINPDLASQMDVFPTICGILDLEYTNLSPGLDLTREKRDFVLMNADDKLGVLSDSVLIVIPEHAPAKLFYLNDPGISNRLPENSDSYDYFKNRAYSVLQASQWMIKSKKTNLKSKNTHHRN